ncbi:hypothetical protein L3Q82_024502 [Scortum barcoo]|uniref:Uncharacterized protein n=1 Tax=Scortum barcoo TaxID=214431 RepID=A0ACB8WPC4_9TELE|nr:hypothetical protein L3Q82_024502 [Scortum barcoo]
MFKHKGVHQCIVAPGHPRPEVADRLCCQVSSDLRPYVLDTRVKRGAELSTNHHLVVSWIRWQRRKLDRPGRPKRIVRVCWEHLAEHPLSGRSSTPTSGRASHRFRGRLGTLSPSGPCSLPPLWPRQFKVVDTRSLVPVVAATPEPSGGHRKAVLVCAWAEKGADALGPDGLVVHSDAYPPETLVDTLGAGDTFNSAVIYTLSNGGSLQDALTFGCKIAGRKCGFHGYDGIIEKSTDN